MAITGRPPKPTALKIVQGNPGKRQLNDAEPIPDREAGKPIWLKGRAGLIWDEYAPELITLGVLKGCDVHAFAAWCQLSVLVERGSHKMPSQQLAQWRALCSEFGLNPSSRSRLKIDKRPSADPAEKYFRRA